MSDRWEKEEKRPRRSERDYLKKHKNRIYDYFEEEEELYEDLEEETFPSYENDRYIMYGDD